MFVCGVFVEVGFFLVFWGFFGGFCFVVCIACPSKLRGLGFGVVLKFSLGIRTCLSLTPSQVNACWDKGGSLLGERSILNSCLFQSLSELHTSIPLLLVYCFTLGRGVTEGISLRPMNGCTLPLMCGFPHPVKLSTSLGWTLRKPVKRSVIGAYFCQRINALIK